ncbi:MAG TPA: SRPBCC family protein [Actinomycetospora sp.]|uniref:SRPBCC family protein n=1 Tax=Actinomycetospora sp. TaxID=1872135 RepID=UPI002F42B5BA
MDTSKKVKASKVINAPAEDIFALLADPNRHTEFDGADMLRGPEGDAAPIGGIGQTFTMNMYAPDLGEYRMINTVVAFLPGARIGWGPRVDPTCSLAEQLGDMDAGGHTYTYDLKPVDGGTEVTQTYEWMSVKDPNFEAFFPRVSQEQLAATLDNLEAAVS